MAAISEQLEIFGLDEARRIALATITSPRERSRLLRRVEVAHELMSELPAHEDLSFLHSGLCQTCLPHSRPVENHAVWQRKSPVAKLSHYLTHLPCLRGRGGNHALLRAWRRRP